jgi:serine/threonine protein kinase
MSAQSERVARPDVWTDWERRVVNGLFPLRRFLGRSNHSAVFLTEYKGENLTDAAIKFVPADSLHTEAQLVQWGTAATLSHPHLLRLFDVGRCRFGGRPFLFVVMEYADQTLAQILPKRALSTDEAREMLLPTLDALSFLHGSSLVHSQLKPSNFLVVNDQLKLASDAIRPIGSPGPGSISTASDIWDLGITLVEALTQRTPTWPDERSETAILPASLPPVFVDTVRRCLSRTPANRPTVVELEAQYKPLEPTLPSSSASQPSTVAETDESAPTQQSPKQPLLALGAAAVFFLALASLVGLRTYQSHHDAQRPVMPAQVQSQPAELPVGSSEGAAPEPAAPAAIEATATPVAFNQQPAAPAYRPPPEAASPPSPTSPGVLHEETPDVPHAITQRIRGHVKVTVRVLVDPYGKVVGEFMENSGPSRYFARLASEAAAKWQFIETDNRNSRVWLVRFEFTRDGIAMQATTAQ